MWTRPAPVSSMTSTGSFRDSICLPENTKSRFGFADIRRSGWPFLSAPETPTTFAAGWSLSLRIELEEIGDDPRSRRLRATRPGGMKPMAVSAAVGARFDNSELA